MERRGILPEWVSDEEEDYVEGVEPQGDVKLKRLFKSFLVEISRPRSEVRTYDGSLNAEELINQINALDQYFDYEEVYEAKKVTFAMTKMRGHASIWWDGIQADKRSKGKEKIRGQSKIVTNLKGKFLPKDYQLSLFRKLKNLKQKAMSII